MVILISGGCKNGKSSLAQDLAVSLAQTSQKSSSLIYFATMIPHDSEDEERIKKHIADRAGMGFKTVECGKDMEEAILKTDEGSVVLFDSLTALVANEMFEGRKDFDFSKDELNELKEKLQNGLLKIIQRADSLVFVSDTIFCDGSFYDKTTEAYRKILAETENFIARKADKIYEMTGGIAVSKEDITMQNEGITDKNNDAAAENKRHMLSKSGFFLITGGSYQGKTKWAESNLNLSPEEICVCKDNSLPDFSKPCLSHYENYIAYCLKNSIEAETDFTSSAVRTVICDDIFCGVVPVDAFQRKLREQTGLALQKIAARNKARLIRIFCGRAQII